MPKTKQELLDGLREKNDEYHEKIADLLKSPHLITDCKAEIGALANNIFNIMKQLDVKVESQLFPPEEQ